MIEKLTPLLAREGVACRPATATDVFFAGVAARLRVRRSTRTQAHPLLSFVMVQEYEHTNTRPFSRVYLDCMTKKHAPSSTGEAINRVDVWLTECPTMQGNSVMSLDNGHAIRTYLSTFSRMSFFFYSGCMLKT